MSAQDRQHGGDHYKRMGVEPWSVVDTWPRDQRIGFYRGNALKYIMRMDDKDAPADNIGKAAHYCEKLAEVLREPVMGFDLASGPDATVVAQSIPETSGFKWYREPVAPYGSFAGRRLRPGEKGADIATTLHQLDEASTVHPEPVVVICPITDVNCSKGCEPNACQRRGW